MKIKIYVQKQAESHILYVNDKKRDFVLVDTQESCYNADRFIFKLCDMVSNWPHELKNDSVIDGICYTISIKPTENEEKLYVFKNNFPEDILRLEMLINEVLKEVKHV